VTIASEASYSYLVFFCHFNFYEIGIVKASSDHRLHAWKKKDVGSFLTYEKGKVLIYARECSVIIHETSHTTSSYFYGRLYCLQSPIMMTVTHSLTVTSANNSDAQIK